MGIIRYSYYKHIKNKEKITNCFITTETSNIRVSDLQHINMMCHILLSNAEDLDKTHFTHTIQEISNIVNSIDNKE